MEFKGVRTMKNFLFTTIIFISASSGLRADDLANNAYVQLYEQWLALDHNQVERLELIRQNLLIDLKRAQKLAETKVMTHEELEDKETKYRLAELTLKRQQVKIKESEARLSIVKSKVAAGMTDIPICIRPMDPVSE
jgi:multidrug resistance efflux pump